MIGRLTGVIAEKSPPLVLIDVQGVGYEVDVPMSTFYNLPPLGDKVSLLTHFVVREDAQILFGFLTSEERATFRQLIKISGVGPKMALALLSGLSVAELAAAVTRQDAARLVKVPGVGKKTAERLLLELKDKLGADLALPVNVANDAQGWRSPSCSSVPVVLRCCVASTRRCRWSRSRLSTRRPTTACRCCRCSS